MTAKLLLEQDWAAQPDDEHRAAWRYLEENTDGYPPGLDIPPLKPGKDNHREGLWAGVEFVSDADYPDDPNSLAGAVVSFGADYRTLEDAGSDDFPARLAAALFTSRTRGAAFVCLHGGRRDFHLLFRRCYRAWLSQGFTLHPTAIGPYIKTITVRKQKHAWHLVDFLSLVGLERENADEIAAAFHGPAFDGATPAQRAAVAAGVFAGVVRESFGVRCGVTAGRTAVSAVARHVPDDRWLWRPSTLAVGLARVGRAFRGGYCFYPAYRGPGHVVDIRRAYSWALSQELPYGSAYARCTAGGHEQDGIYLCRLRGPGYYPVYVAPWGGATRGFTPRLWNGDECLCVLPTAEFAGLRALGYRVEPAFGAAFSGSVSIAGFIRQCDAIRARYGDASPHGLVAKGLANRVYGKLAESPARQSLTFAVDRPVDGALPYLDAAGEEVEAAWCVDSTAYRAHQHVDIAAHVTALVRSKLYAAMARCDESGVGVLAVDTDGMVLSADPTGVLALDGAVSGSWRYTRYDPDVIINGPRFALIGGRVLAAGSTNVDPSMVELAYDQGTVTVRGRVMAPAWSNGPTATDVRRRLSRAD